MRRRDLSGAALKNKKKREAKSGRAEEQSQSTTTTVVIIASNLIHLLIVCLAVRPKTPMDYEELYFEQFMMTGWKVVFEI